MGTKTEGMKMRPKGEGFLHGYFSPRFASVPCVDIDEDKQLELIENEWIKYPVRTIMARQSK